jgi:hypothetical protein
MSSHRTIASIINSDATGGRERGGNEIKINDAIIC